MILIPEIMKSHVESFDRIIFENRNLEYGAYYLRSTYSKRAAASLVISISIFVLLAGVPFISQLFNPTEIHPEINNRTDGTWINIEESIPVKPVTPFPPNGVPNKDQIFTNPEFVDTITNEQIELATNEEYLNAGTSVKFDTTQKVNDIPEFTQIPDEEVFLPTGVLAKPYFPNGEKALLIYVAEHTKYPNEALEKGIEGTVYVRFVVTKSGEIGIAKVMRQIDPFLEEEALRVIKSMPKWSPGKNNGNPVNVWFVIPVKFVLQN
jgi:protein TonB